VGIIDEETHSNSVTIPYRTDITGMSARVVHTGSSISPDPATARSYAGPVTYTVTAEEGASQNYTVTASAAKIASIGDIEASGIGGRVRFFPPVIAGPRRKGSRRLSALSKAERWELLRCGTLITGVR
jgi:hypothetical protein